jgi:hypothetical protein
MVTVWNISVLLEVMTHSSVPASACSVHVIPSSDIADLVESYATATNTLPFQDILIHFAATPGNVLAIHVIPSNEYAAFVVAVNSLPATATPLRIDLDVPAVFISTS